MNTSILKTMNDMITTESNSLMMSTLEIAQLTGTEHIQNHLLARNYSMIQAIQAQLAGGYVDGKLPKQTHNAQKQLLISLDWFTLEDEWSDIELAAQVSFNNYVGNPKGGQQCPNKISSVIRGVAGEVAVEKWFRKLSIPYHPSWINLLTTGAESKFDGLIILPYRGIPVEVKTVAPHQRMGQVMHKFVDKMASCDGVIVMVVVDTDKKSAAIYGSIEASKIHKRNIEKNSYNVDNIQLLGQLKL